MFGKQLQVKIRAIPEALELGNRHTYLARRLTMIKKVVPLE